MAEFEAVERNLRLAMQVYSRATEEGEVRHLPGVSLVSSGLPLGVFNSALLSEPVGDGAGALERRIAMATVHFRACGLPWSFWLCEDLLDEATRRRSRGIFLDQGFRIASSPTGMYADALAAPAKALPRLDVRRVGDAVSRRDFSEVTGAAFHLTRATSRQLYDHDRVWAGAFQGYVGYHGGVAVTAGAATVDQSVGLYSVGTLPEHRRRGYAEALLRRIVADAVALHGQRPLVLQATRMGQSLYERMGFRPVTLFTVYVS